MVRQSQQVMAALQQQLGQQAKRLLTPAQGVLPLVERIITQARRRVLEGKKVDSAKPPESSAWPASGKLSEERKALEQTRTWKRGYRPLSAKLTVGYNVR